MNILRLGMRIGMKLNKTRVIRLGAADTVLQE
jgi:hypothetical protein